MQKGNAFGAEPSVFILPDGLQRASVLRSEAEAYAVYGRGAFQMLKNALAEASPADKREIGAGLALAALECQGKKDELARKIFDFARAANDQFLLEGFSNTLRDERQAAARTADGAGDYKKRRRLSIDDSPKEATFDPWKPLPVPGTYKVHR